MPIDTGAEGVTLKIPLFFDIRLLVDMSNRKYKMGCMSTLERAIAVDL